MLTSNVMQFEEKEDKEEKKTFYQSINIRTSKFLPINNLAKLLKITF